MRPLGVPAFDDKLLQEVVRMVLEAIYEGHFENTSHGFRPYRSCHTALTLTQNTFNGAKWFIEGDIRGFFDNINHHVLIKTLEERISDDRFIRLIRKFLNAGYIEEWKFHKTYSGTPQGGVVSPILANIYLDKLDKYMKQYTENFDKGTRRKPSKERKEFDNARKRTVCKIKSAKNRDEKRMFIKDLKKIEKERCFYPSCDEMDENYKRIKYVRYADDFLIGIIGSKENARKVKEDIKNFLYEQLALELSDEKTLITHSEKAAKFLGYEIYVSKSNQQRRDRKGRLRRTYGKRLKLKVSAETIRKKLLQYGVLQCKYLNGKEIWKSKGRPALAYKDDLTILDRYNSEIRGFCNYYAIANNCAKLSYFKYIMEYSMYKTFAGKYKSSTSKIIRKYRKNGIFTVKYTSKTGKTKERQFYKADLKRKDAMKVQKIDVIPKMNFFPTRTSLTERLKSKRCELCGAKENLTMHHVRKLKDLQGNKDWEKLMMAKRRKTLAVCDTCHGYIHAA